MPAVRLVNPGRMRRRNARHGGARKRRMPSALRAFWATHRRQGKRIVSSRPARRRRNAHRGRRRRNQPAALKKYWAKVKHALSGSASNPRRRRRSNTMAKRRRSRRRMPTALRRYWASHRRSGNRRRRRNPSMFGRRRRRSNRRTVIVMRGRNRGYRRRHNPLLAVPMSELVPLTAWAVGGMAGARILPQMLAPSYNQGWTGYGLNVSRLWASRGSAENSPARGRRRGFSWAVSSARPRAFWRTCWAARARSAAH